jgi:hypothetical protein
MPSDESRVSSEGSGTGTPPLPVGGRLPRAKEPATDGAKGADTEASHEPGHSGGQVIVTLYVAAPDLELTRTGPGLDSDSGAYPQGVVFEPQSASGLGVCSSAQRPSDETAAIVHGAPPSHAVVAFVNGRAPSATEPDSWPASWRRSGDATAAPRSATHDTPARVSEKPEEGAWAVAFGSSCTPRHAAMAAESTTAGDERALSRVIGAVEVQLVPFLLLHALAVATETSTAAKSRVLPTRAERASPDLPTSIASS